MNVIDLLYDILLNFFYNDNAVLQPYQQEVMYLVSWAIAIFCIFTTFKFIFKCLFNFWR